MVADTLVSSRLPGMGVLRWIFGGFFALVGLALLAFATATMITASNSRTWPQAQGTMLVSAVDRKTSTARDGPGRTSSTSTSYMPRVEYRYEVDGEAHTGTRLELLERGEGTRAKVAAKLEKFPQGAKVAVYYDPDDPAQSVLKPGTPDAMGIAFLLGFVALLVGGGIMLFMRPRETGRHSR